MKKPGKEILPTGDSGSLAKKNLDSSDMTMLVESQEINQHKIERFCNTDNTIVQSGKTSISRIGNNTAGIRFMTINDALRSTPH